MGAGLIGCEFANDRAALLPEAAGAQLQDALSDLGVQWHWGTTVQSVAVSAAAAGPKFTVQLFNGLAAGTDALLIAIDLIAYNALAQAVGVACDRGIVVDATLAGQQTARRAEQAKLISA